MLGNAIEIVRGVNDIGLVIPYYEKIGLEMIDEGETPKKWAVFSDGRINIRIIENNYINTGFIYYNENLHELAEMLNDLGENIISKNDDEIILEDPNNFRVIILNKPYNNDLIPDMFAESKNPYGYFGEMAFAVKDFDKSKEFWEKIGYVKIMEMDDPYKWGIFTDGRMVIGLHQNGKQEAEAVTYFTTKMVDQIHLLQQKGIEFHEGYMINLNEGNGITNAPDGLTFFFFEGEIVMPEESKRLL